MKPSVSCVIFLPGSSISQRSGGATATRMLSGSCAVWLQKMSHCRCLARVCVCLEGGCNRRASFIRHAPPSTRVDKWVTDVSVETDSKWWKMCLQQFSELFSWERGPFSALEVIALSIKKTQLNVKLQANAVWVHKARPYSWSALSSLSGRQHGSESQGCFLSQKLHEVKIKRFKKSIWVQEFRSSFLT